MYEELPSYYPNYWILDELSQAEQTYGANALENNFWKSLVGESQSKCRFSLENFVQTALAQLESNKEVFLPLIVRDDSLLAGIMKSILRGQFVLVSHRDQQFICTSITNINDNFFRPLSESFKRNLHLLFFVLYAEQTFGKHYGFLTSYILSNPLFKGYCLSTESILRLIVLSKFLIGENIYELMEDRFREETIFSQTLELFFPEEKRPARRKFREMFNIFVSRIKSAGKIDFASYFDVGAGAFDENSTQSDRSFHSLSFEKNAKNSILSQKNTTAMQIEEKQLKRGERRKKFNFETTSRFIDRSVRFDYKKLNSFQKILANGSLKRIPKRHGRFSSSQTPRVAIF